MTRKLPIVFKRLSESRFVCTCVIISIVFGVFLNNNLQAKGVDYGPEYRKKNYHDGNLIQSVFYNYGALADVVAEPVLSGIYPKGSGHLYYVMFTPYIGAEVVDTKGDTVHIFSDGRGGLTEMKDMSPQGYQWGFEPLAGYANPDQKFVAMSDDSTTWPSSWPDRDQNWTGLWNGQYGKYARADQESYWRMNDYVNDEFAFYPVASDSSIRGLALEIEVRGYQWAHPAAEDILIWTFWVTNTGDVDYQKVVFGVYGDPQSGGNGDSNDDLSWFDTQADIVYTWDYDSRGEWGGIPAYFGWKFLESPGNPHNGIDNDEDGLLDELQFNDAGTFIVSPSEDPFLGDEALRTEKFGPWKPHWVGDEDGDWNPETDDVGTDGLRPENPAWPGPDFDGTEGNGKPDLGEPNFGYTDNDEADQIGLTSFNAAVWPAIQVKEDEQMWIRMTPGNFDEIIQNVNQIFAYGSGYFPLHAGEKKKFAIAILFGEDEDDIKRNAEVMQAIYDADYAFAKPPIKPRVSAVAGDRKVTLFWDNRAEKSWDPMYGNDFEGYRVYRSTDPAFLGTRLISDSWGNKTFHKPLAQYDLKNGLKGLHPIDYNGIQYEMGNDTGLAYSFEDTTVDNGQTYYYAVVSYDQGYDTDFYERGISQQEGRIPIAPAECTKIIDVDATGVVTKLDANTVKVVPNAAAAGFIAPSDRSTENGGIEHISGSAYGKIEIKILDPLKVPNNWEYQVVFDDSTFIQETNTNKSFSVKNLQFIKEQFVADSSWIKLAHTNLVVSSVKVTGDSADDLYRNGIDYTVNYENGTIKVIISGEMVFGNSYQMVYQYYPVFRNPSVHGENTYPWFDGMQIRVVEDTLQPFTHDDVYYFIMDTARFDEEKAKIEMDKIAVVPNPYIVTASWEPKHSYSFGRGQRKLDFIHLPPVATIRIYTLRGDLVKVLEHNSPINDGSESWNLLSRDGMEIAYGIYIYYVDAPGIGEKVGKFAVIK